MGKALVATATAVLFAALATAHPARAQQTAGADKLAAAEVLFNDGKALFDKGQFVPACDKFQESYSLDPAIGALINLARCHEKIGRSASAWAEYRAVETMANRAGQKEREETAKKAAATLEPRLARLTIKVYAPVDGLEVTRNGVPVGKAQWGVSLPVDPGDVRIEAKAPKKKAFASSVSVKPGPSSIDWELPPLEDAPLEVAPPPSVTGGAPAVHNDGMSGTKIAGLVIGGGGIVALGLAAGFQLVALSEDKKSSSNFADADKATDAATKEAFRKAGDSSHAAAKTDQTVAVVAASVGAAALIGGLVVFFVVAPKRDAAATKWRPEVVPMMGKNTAGGTLGFRF